MELKPIPSIPEYRDPLHMLLEYISEEAPPDCDVLLVHDDDLAQLGGIYDNTPLDGLRSDVVLSHIRSLKPTVYNTRIALPSACNSASVDTELACVATLSDIFGKQCEFPISLGLHLGYTADTESPYRVQLRPEPRYVSAHDGNPRASAYPSARHIVPSQISSGALDLAYPYPGQHQSDAIYTDDATTKLNDRIRRQCFNCCTTDTSTWRRSSLNPGKVLCNKCGLFERTHNRPRPGQFPRKRSPLATSSLTVRESPPQHGGALPPVAALPPHQYNHPSIGPLLSRTGDAHATSRGDELPEIQSWLPPVTTPAAPILHRPRSA
ncbi:hypothetical protein H4582DRAFT_731673 [Lactarius indigo]|nr:hypothetical protein H4582DRAFT_731673 [Lactarius indigo]